MFFSAHFVVKCVHEAAQRTGNLDPGKQHFGEKTLAGEGCGVHWSLTEKYNEQQWLNHVEPVHTPVVWFLVELKCTAAAVASHPLEVVV